LSLYDMYDVKPSSDVFKFLCFKQVPRRHGVQVVNSAMGYIQESGSVSTSCQPYVNCTGCQSADE